MVIRIIMEAISNPIKRVYREQDLVGGGVIEITNAIDGGYGSNEDEEQG